MGGVSSEAAQKAGGGAMSTRGELARRDEEDWPSDYEAEPGIARNAFRRGQDALIAEGWRKKPTSAEVARALSLAMAENPYTWEELPTQMCPDDRDGTTKLVKTLHLNPLVDAILALIDRGQ